MTMQGEEQQLMDQQMIDQQVQWINDSVQRDILLGDWKTKRASTNNRYPIIVFLVVFLVAAFLMIAAYSITVKAAPPSPEVPSVELYRQEMAKMLGDNPYDSIMSPESREQFEKLHSQADEISLVNPEGNAYLTVNFDTPLVGIWSPAGKHAPFICIEPWCGRTDSTDFAGELAEREYGNTLEPEGEFVRAYTVRFR